MAWDGFNRAQTPYQKNKMWESGANFGANEFNQAVNDIAMGYAGGVINNDSWLENLQNKASGLAESLGGMQGIASGLGGIGDIMNAFNARKSLKLAKDKFNFEKGLAAANYANQAKAYNEELGRSADVGLALGGNAISPEQRQATLAKVEANKVAPTLNL